MQLNTFTLHLPDGCSHHYYTDKHSACKTQHEHIYLSNSIIQLSTLSPTPATTLKCCCLHVNASVTYHQMNSLKGTLCLHLLLLPIVRIKLINIYFNLILWLQDFWTEQSRLTYDKRFLVSNINYFVVFLAVFIHLFLRIRIDPPNSLQV